MNLINFWIILGLISGFNAFPSAILPVNDKPEVVGGLEADKGEFPWMINILRPPNHFCGATIVNKEWVVTAAHCSQGLPETYTLVAGDHLNNVDDGTEQVRNVIRIVNHPDYYALTIENDIALMKVSPPFDFNDFVQPVKLAPVGFAPIARSLQVVAGWGHTAEGGSSPTALLKAFVPYVTDDECRKAYGSRIMDTMMCAGEEGKDACQGDSGGPLMCPEEGTDVGGVNVLCGVVSWGTGCARPDLPGVYTEVSHFLGWIDSVINE